MSDVLLLARIESLDKNLLRVDRSLEKLQEQSAGHDILLEDDFWIHLNKQVRQQFKRQRRTLAELRETLIHNGGGEATGTADTWSMYAQVRDESERLFEESLEFIGGLTFRRTGLDNERVFELADRIIVTCAREAYAEPWHFLTVPSLREVVTKSRARLSRIRFPEWTIWTLPVTAYVLGHEVMEEHEVAPLVRRRMDAWARQDVAYAHLHVFLADVFGAYVMGPAFGQASIWLRFDPSRAHFEDKDHPAERSRAHVILRTLETMEGHDGDELWRANVRSMRDEWNEAIESAAPRGSWPDEPASLNELVADALEYFEEGSLTTQAVYSLQRWMEAKRIYAQWHSEARISDEQALATEPQTLTTARDVLNAAWLQRLEFPDDMARTERAVVEMCKRVLFRGRSRPGQPGQDPINAE